jgi:hypothetical protein
MRRQLWSEWIWSQLELEAITLDEAVLLLSNEILVRAAGERSGASLS